MRGEKYTDNSKRLETARRRLEQWRQGREGRSRIPNALWAEATKLGCKYGVYRTARMLRLDYQCLKDRVTAASKESSKRRKKHTFVEVPFNGRAAGECTVEIESGSGSKLCVQLKGSAVSEVSSLARVFYESESCCS